MQLDRTIIIPTDDANLAISLLKSLIYDEDCILAIVLGDSEESKSAVVKADKRAEVVMAGFARKVAWVRNPAIVQQVLDKMQPGLSGGGIIAVSVSLANKVADTIRSGEPIDFFRIEQLFLKAGI